MLRTQSRSFRGCRKSLIKQHEMQIPPSLELGEPSNFLHIIPTVDDVSHLEQSTHNRLYKTGKSAVQQRVSSCKPAHAAFHLQDSV